KLGALLLRQALELVTGQRPAIPHGHADDPRRGLLDLKAALSCRALDLLADLLLSPLHLGERLLAAGLELLALERARDLLTGGRQPFVEIAAQVAAAAGGQQQRARMLRLGEVVRVDEVSGRRPPAGRTLQEVQDRALPARAGGAG